MTTVVCLSPGGCRPRGAPGLTARDAMGPFAVLTLADSARPRVAVGVQRGVGYNGTPKRGSTVRKPRDPRPMSAAHRSTPLLRHAFPPIVGPLVPQCRSPTGDVSALALRWLHKPLMAHQPKPRNPLTKTETSGLLTIRIKNIGSIRPPHPGPFGVSSRRGAPHWERSAGR